MSILRWINSWFARHVFYKIPNVFFFNYFLALPGFVLNHGRFPKSINSINADLNDFWFMRMIDPEKTVRLKKYVDKVSIKNLVREVFGSELRIAKTLRIIHMHPMMTFKDFRYLMESFRCKDVIAKPTHGSGCVVDMFLDNTKDLKKLYKAARQDYFHTPSRETQYDGLEKKVIVEERLKTDGNDYKFFCAYGHVLFAYIYFADKTRKCIIMPSLPLVDGDVESKYHPTHKGKIKFPKCWDKMIKVAQEMSTNFEFVRVDLYNVRGKVGFGELTFTPGGSFVKFGDKEFSQLFLQSLKEAKNNR